MNHKVKIIHKSWLSHDVIQLRLEKPESFEFNAGQAIEATMEDDRFSEIMSPFTLTGLSSDAFLELTFKVYPQREGLTLAISNLQEGETIIITDPWDSYLNKGPGTFIAGGAGITPFVAILRQLKVDGNINDSRLFFSNKTEKDIFLYDELSQILGKNFINILTREKKEGYLHGRIDRDFLRKHIVDGKKPIYICGPDDFMEQIRDMLIEEGVDKDLINISL